MRDKKRSIWILIIFFGLLILAGLALNSGNSTGDMAMMGLSMGGMMKVHHTGQINPADLLKPIKEDHGMGDTTGHHLLAPILESIAFLTTITVFLFIPLLLGGAALLIVLWS